MHAVQQFLGKLEAERKACAERAVGWLQCSFESDAAVCLADKERFSKKVPNLLSHSERHARFSEHASLIKNAAAGSDEVARLYARHMHPVLLRELSKFAACLLDEHLHKSMPRRTAASANQSSNLRAWSAGLCGARNFDQGL